MAKEELEGLGTSVANFLLDFDSDHARYSIHHCVVNCVMIFHDWVVHRAIKLADMIDELGKWLAATKMLAIEDSVGYVHSYFACNR